MIVLTGDERWYIGDPCYVMSDEAYDKTFENVDWSKLQTEHREVVKNLPVAVGWTAFGDGTYTGTNGLDYGVDSGTIAVVPFSLVDQSKLAPDMCIIEADEVRFSCVNGTLNINYGNQTLAIDTNWSEDEDSSFDDDDYEDEED